MYDHWMTPAYTVASIRARLFCSGILKISRNPFAPHLDPLVPQNSTDMTGAKKLSLPARESYNIGTVSQQ